MLALRMEPRHGGQLIFKQLKLRFGVDIQICIMHSAKGGNLRKLSIFFGVFTLED